MRLIIVGSDDVFAIENYFVKYLRLEGIEVDHFPAYALFNDYYKKNLINKLFFKIGISFIYKQINLMFMQRVNLFQPHVIWIFKGMEIYPDSLKLVKAKGIKLLNYNPDNPFIFSGKGSGNTNLKRSIPHYDLHVTYNSSIKERMQKEYKIPSTILPFGYEIDQELLYDCRKQNEVLKVCFLGNPDIFRGKFLESLAKNGIEIDVYGNNWKKFVDHKNIKIFDPVQGRDFWLTLYKYRIQLNLMRPHNPDAHNMRSFEVPGVGGILLAPDTLDHNQYFVSNKEIFLYRDLQSCMEQIKFLLSLSILQAEAIRNDARNRSIVSKYNYQSRAQQSLEFLQKLYES